jgi:hypothetical protein
LAGASPAAGDCSVSATVFTPDPGSAVAGVGNPALISSGAADPFVESSKVDPESELIVVDPEIPLVELALLAGATGAACKLGLETPAIWAVSEAGTSVFTAAVGLAAGSLLAASSAHKRPGTAPPQNDTSKSTHIHFTFRPNALIYSLPSSNAHQRQHLVDA